MLRNIAVPVLAPVPAFELGMVCEAFGLDLAPPGMPAYDFAVCGEQVMPGAHHVRLRRGAPARPEPSCRGGPDHRLGRGATIASARR